MGIAPFFKSVEDWFEGLAFFCELIFDLGRDYREDGAVDEAAGFEFSELLGEHALRDAVYGAHELSEAHFSIKQVGEDHTLPFSADKFGGGLDWAGRTGVGGMSLFVLIGIHSVTTGLDCAYLRVLRVSPMNAVSVSITEDLGVEDQ